RPLVWTYPAYLRKFLLYLMPHDVLLELLPLLSLFSLFLSSSLFLFLSLFFSSFFPLLLLLLSLSPFLSSSLSLLLSSPFLSPFPLLSLSLFPFSLLPFLSGYLFLVLLFLCYILQQLNYFQL